MKKQKINIELGIKTVFTDTNAAISKFKSQLEKLSQGDGLKGKEGKLLGNFDKELVVFEKLLEKANGFKLNTENIREYGDLIAKMRTSYELLVENANEVERAEKRTFDNRIESARLKEEELKTILATRNAAANERKAQIDNSEDATEKAKLTKSWIALKGGVTKASKALELHRKETQGLSQEQFKSSETLDRLRGVVKQASTATNEYAGSVENAKTELDKLSQENLQKSINTQIKRWTSLGIVVSFAKKQFSQMRQTYMELDKSLTSIAVVSGKTRDEMWGMIGTYNQMAQRLGTTTKEVVESSRLYFQQGRSQSEVMKLVEQTTILASISELEFSKATNYMTAAINGFKLSAENAIEVTDIWANLSSQAAVSTEELAVAISKVASISQSAGMDISATSAFLTKMINLIMLARA